MPIQMSRLKRNILQLAKISDGGNGVTRRSSTKAYAEGLSFVTGLMQDAGMKFVKFSPADAKSYLDTFNKAILDDFKKAANPESFNRTAERFLK